MSADQDNTPVWTRSELRALIPLITGGRLTEVWPLARVDQAVREHLQSVYASGYNAGHSDGAKDAFSDIAAGRRDPHLNAVNQIKAHAASLQIVAAMMDTGANRDQTLAAVQGMRKALDILESGRGGTGTAPAEQFLTAEACGLLPGAGHPGVPNFQTEKPV